MGTVEDAVFNMQEWERLKEKKRKDKKLTEVQKKDLDFEIIIAEMRVFISLQSIGQKVD